MSLKVIISGAGVAGLVGADGIHSHVRGLVFGAGFERSLGGHYIAISQTLRHGLPAVRTFLPEHRKDGESVPGRVTSR
jgi:hypothetical protein